MLVRSCKKLFAVIDWKTIASHYQLDEREKSTKTYKGIGEKSGLSHFLEETHELEDMKASI